MGLLNQPFGRPARWWWAAAACLGLIAILGAGDYGTDTEGLSALLYLLPVSLGTWVLGRRLGLGLAVLCFFTSYAVDRPHAQIVDKAGQFGTFVAAVLLLSRLKAHEGAELRYRRLFESAKDGILILHADTGRVLDVNPFLAELLGFSREEFLGKKIWDLGFFKDVCASQAHFAELQRKAYAHHEDLALETHDGRRIEVEFVSNVYQVDQEKVVQVNLRDITERVRAQEARLASQQRIQTQQECVSAVVVSEAFVNGEVEQLARQVAELAAKTVGVERANVWLFNEDETELRCIDLYEATPDRHSAGAVLTQAQFANEFAALKQARYVDAHDARTDPRTAGYVESYLQPLGITAMLDAVLQASGRRLGLLCLEHVGKPHVWERDEVVFACQLADKIAIALVNRERRVAERTLSSSEQRYQRLFESAKDGILILDAETGTVVDVNPFLLELLGLSRETLLGRRVWELGFLKDVLASRADFAELQREEYVRYEDLPLETGGGRRIEVEFVSNVPLANEEKVVQCNIRDITERVRAQGSQARLMTAVEQSPETIVITDADGTILYVNPAFEKTSGYLRDEAIGQNPRILKSDKQGAEFYRRMWSTLSRGEVWQGRITNRKKDGTLFDEDATISPVRDATGRIVNYVAVKRDVTRETLLEQQLAQAQKMEAVGRLAGGVAHDFNNLLGVITGYGELVHRRLADEDPLKGKVEQILKAGARAADLTRQLLAFGRKQVLSPRILDLNEVVSNMQKMLPRVLGEDVDLVAVLAPHLGSVMVDPGQIDQILMNLAVNARDAMPGGGQITIETRNAHLDASYVATHAPTRPGPYVLLAVTDTGSGMDAATQARIFEPFFTTKEVGKGTGLGLSTVYGIVKQSDGYVWVYSEVGEGTTFKIYFPCVDEEAQHAAAALPGLLLRGSETILLVEDEASLREMLREVLDANGHTVLVAREGAEALQRAAAHAGPIQLMVTDVILPGMTGPKIVDLLAPTRPEMKVLFVSGYSDESVTRHGLIGPGRAFLSKPFGPEVFLRKVRESLDGA